MPDCYDYDVFISYSHKDKQWVTKTLVPRLEQAGLKVCIDSRDFLAGKPALENMAEAISNSRYILLVLTPNWVGSHWTNYEALLSRTSDPDGAKRRTIPLHWKKCDLPEELKILTWVDFTRKDKESMDAAWNQLFKSLEVPDEMIPQPAKVHPGRHKPSKRTPKKKRLSHEHKNLLKFFVVVLVTMVFIVLVVLLALKPALTAITAPSTLSHTLSATATTFPTETASPTNTPTPTEIFTPTIDPTCIQDSIWSPYTTDTTKVVEKDGICWQLSKWGVALYDDQFSFLASGFRRGEWYTFSRPVARDVTVTFTLTVTSLNDAEIWVGLAEDVDPARNGVFLVRQSNGLFDIRSLDENGYVWTVSNDRSVDHENGAYTIKFTLAGERMAVSINERMWSYGDIPAPFTSPRLHLGYRPVVNGLINARVTVPQVTEK